MHVFVFSGAFKGANSLKNLYLNENELNTILEGTFADLNLLTYVDLNYNPIQSLEIGEIMKTALLL